MSIPALQRDSRKAREVSYLHITYRMASITFTDPTGKEYDSSMNDNCLKDVFGIKGSADKGKPDIVKVIYSFEPCNIGDPVLLT